MDSTREMEGQRCMICLETIDLAVFREGEACDHLLRTCWDCLEIFIVQQYSQLHPSLGCFDLHCNFKLSYNVLKRTLHPETFTQYDDVLLKRCLAEAPDTHPCLKTKCGAYFFYEKLPEDKAICPNCGHSLCTRCFRPMNTHQEWKCEKITSMTGQEIVDKARETEGIKHCPGCSTLLEHAGGCNLTKCGICEKSFCWSCCRPSEDGRTVEHDYDCPSHPHYFARQQDVVTQDTVPPSPLLDMSSPGALYQPQTPHTRAMTEEAVSTVPQRAPWQHAAEWLRARDSLRRTPEDQTDNFFDGRRTIGVRPGGRRASTQESWDFSWEQASRNPSGSASNPERHAEEDGKKDK